MVEILAVVHVPVNLEVLGQVGGRVARDGPHDVVDAGHDAAEGLDHGLVQRHVAARDQDGHQLLGRAVPGAGVDRRTGHDERVDPLGMQGRPQRAPPPGDCGSPIHATSAAFTGKGVGGTIDGHAVMLGNQALLAKTGIDLLRIDLERLAAKADTLRRDGQTVMLAAIDGRAAGLLGVADPIKESSYEAVRTLRDDGVRIVMLTGDSRITAEAVARKLGLDGVEAEVMPADKARVVKRLQSEGRIVAMAGDGINDAPALAQAQVGIAMGTGTDIAMESAGVTLVQGDLRGIVKARRLSRATMRNIRQNLFFAFVYNALGIPIAAGVLYPVIRPAAESDDRERRDER